ncbi:PREDICTED: thioredoxin-like 1-1, chloroplastic [Nelumbo nucifera]|uniref:Thioredoxin-like 1-1, chloroplastic n=1 Tax=Nelumbo nucifera TaxID=4432 RepID=A0A1U7ZUC2_NELNU|nr:PREDICTED: thioredoxin-like 1-1, chloroplastic [Nelumbo nucifera]
MAFPLRSDFHVVGSNGIALRSSNVLGLSPSLGSFQIADSQSVDLPVLKSDFRGQQVIVSDQMGLGDRSVKASPKFSVHAQASICISRALRWWEKTPKPNMIDINSAQELVDVLLNAGDRLVVLDFYSPGCGGCKALHPKICQLAESNPNALFVKVNYEKLKSMCYSLNIHVLPFFRFYRGAEGRLCSFSCTNATIKKFKDALAKHGTERCSLGPAKGLDESELQKLVANGEISINSASKSMGKQEMEDLVRARMKNISNSSSFEFDKENPILVANV